jgi:Mycothiol maleylpyruvate isomerase N-terminal domain
MTAAPDRQAIYDELDRIRRDFATLTATATTDSLKAPSDGTRWTNQELLYHMVFGYLVTRTLFPLVTFFAFLPRPASRAFAALLNAGTAPFNVANYIASVLGARVLNPARMNWLLNRITTQLATHLAQKTDRGLDRGMHFPTRWDPFFTDYMTIGDLHHYPTQHYDFHRNQLTL